MQFNELKAILDKSKKSSVNDEELHIVFEAYNLLFPTQKKAFTKCVSCVRDTLSTVTKNLELLEKILV
ncbi:hypothetical protein UFOVP782_20 [uncultured Caudovirales phage]|uniref:Uncharacterized protein n=1 Tax=uncultured Caudovirales phage TaxID=2100421 RepID=A0A6J5NX88_9CAUD|nr:hypothetical protein UFOVP782_20 [uncultured Caudovirales phage]